MNKLPVDDLIAAVERTVINTSLPWVLFANGTFVILNPGLSRPDMEAAALQLIAQFGPVHIGTQAADFSVSALQHVAGWAVSSHQPGLFTYVHPGELGENGSSDLAVGLVGRAKRHQDSVERQIVHMHSGSNTTI